jgi:RNA polymerase sigma factor (sigma-70 family)
MVLSVCRSVLGDRHDAEDACQATFLILAQRSGSIRRRDAVASWLYGVARRVAQKARREAARRREREQKWLEHASGAAPAVYPPADSWPELYDELDRLPEPFRAVVVLCDLEGHSYEQAAGLLQCPIGTVQSRLARGRKRLRDRLQRQGFSSAIALLGTGQGLAVRPATAALFPPRLASAITQSALEILAGRSIAGLVPRVLKRTVQAEIGSQIVTRVLSTLAIMIMTALVAAAVIGLTTTEPAGGRKSHAAEAATNAEIRSLHIRVIDSQDHGVAGIPVEVKRPGEPPRVFTTDTDGRVVLPEDQIGDEAYLVAKSANQSMAWTTVGASIPNRSAGTEADPILMRVLPLNHRVEGSVEDLQGNPIPGVAIQAVSLEHPTNGAIYLEAVSRKNRLGLVPTGPAGRFAIALPQETGAALRASHPRYTGHRIHVLRDARTLGPTILIPAGGIAGAVTDAMTGKPVAGAVVGAQLIDQPRHIFDNPGDVATDDHGRFAIDGLEPGVYNLALSTVPGRPELTARAIEGLRVRAGTDTPAELKVIEGRPLRGVVIDPQSEQPVAGAIVNCKGPAHPRSGAWVDWCKTDHEGRFTFHVPPGEQFVYLADGDSQGSRLRQRTLIVPEEGAIDRVRLVRRSYGVSSALMYVRKAAIPQPNPAAKQDFAGKAEGNSLDSEPPVAKEAAPPPAPDGRIVTTRDIFGEGDHDVAVRALAPNVRTLTGKVRDAQGRPIPGIGVTVNSPPGPDIAGTVATDRDGVFEMAGLPRLPLRIVLLHHRREVQAEALAAYQDHPEFILPLQPDASSRDKPAAARDEPIPLGLHDRLTFVDLDRLGNDFLADGPGYGSNDLNRLPRGIHKLGDVYFRIGERMVHVQGTMRSDLPRVIKGIPVGARGQVIHFLHATQYGVDPGTLIGAYVVHFGDGSTEQIPIVYGRSLLNWWSMPDRNEELAGAKVAWRGSNDALDGDPAFAVPANPGLPIRLFDLTWLNPHPQKEIATLDVLSAGKECDPFVVAVTVARP